MLTHTVCVLLSAVPCRYPGSQGKQYFLGLEAVLGGSGDPAYPGGCSARGGGYCVYTVGLPATAQNPGVQVGPSKTVHAGPMCVLGAVGIGLGGAVWDAAVANSSSRSRSMASRLFLDPVLTTDAAAVVNPPAQAAPGSTCSTWAASLRQR